MEQYKEIIGQMIPRINGLFPSMEKITLTMKY